MTEEPESANRWATEHYGFDDAARQEGRVTDAAAARPTTRRNDGRRPRRRTTLIASAFLGLALIAGIGGTAVASADGPGGGRDGISHVDHGGNHGDNHGGNQGGRGGNR